MEERYCKFIPYEEFDGPGNMAIDQNILDESIKNRSNPVLRLYGWSNPTLTIGRNQPIKGINEDYCNLNNIDIVKRPTGGRAVLHDKELTYSFITPADFLDNGHSVLLSYQEISEALIIGLRELNINLDFPEYKKVSVKSGYCMSISTGSDLNCGGKKLIGSAQFRKQDYILQHGSITMDINKEYLQGIFGAEDTQSNLITIKEINPEYANIAVLCEAIKSGFEKKFLLKFC